MLSIFGREASENHLDIYSNLRKINVLYSTISDNETRYDIDTSPPHQFNLYLREYFTPNVQPGMIIGRYFGILMDSPITQKFTLC